EPVAGGLEQGLLARPRQEEGRAVGNGLAGPLGGRVDVLDQPRQVGDVADLLDVQADDTVRAHRDPDDVARVAEGEAGAARQDGFAVRGAATAGPVEGQAR